MFGFANGEVKQGVLYLGPPLSKDVVPLTQWCETDLSLGFGDTDWWAKLKQIRWHMRPFDRTEIVESSITFDRYLLDGTLWERSEAPVANHFDDVRTVIIPPAWIEIRQAQLRDSAYSREILENELEHPALRSGIEAIQVITQQFRKPTDLAPAEATLTYVCRLNQAIRGCFGCKNQEYRPHILKEEQSKLDYWEYQAAVIPTVGPCKLNGVFSNAAGAVFSQDSAEFIRSLVQSQLKLKFAALFGQGYQGISLKWSELPRLKEGQNPHILQAKLVER